MSMTRSLRCNANILRAARGTGPPFCSMSRCSRASMRSTAGAKNSDSPPNSCACWNAIISILPAPARLLGYETFAQYRLDDAMAKTPAAVRSLLDRVWAPARGRALADRDAMQALVAEEGGNFAFAPWDWRYYAEKLRKRRCDLDEGSIKPYLQLDHIIEAAFYTANRLFGLSFERRTDVAGWHPDVRAWEVRGADGRHRGVFFGDYFARSSKRGGAWMTTLRDQEKLTGDIRPLVVNVMN